jgi:hypothetical protein
MQLGKICFELGSEVIVFNIMDGTCESFGMFGGQSPPFRAEMRMIIGSVKQILDTVLFRCIAKKPSHT